MRKYQLLALLLIAKLSFAMVGGWYPIFFSNYDQSQVDSIVESIKAGRVAKIEVTYDQNKELADKVVGGIQSHVNFAVSKKQVVTKDTTETQYNHEQVVVTVTSK